MLLFFFIIICAIQLTSYEFGLYNYAIAIVFLTVLISDFGVSTAVSKYVAEFRAKQDERENNILFNTGIVIFILSIVISLLVLLYAQKATEIGAILLYLIPMIIFAPLTALFDGVYRGRRQFALLAKLTLLGGLISAFLGYFIIHEYGLLGALMAQSFLYIILTTLYASYYKGYTLFYNQALTREVFNYAIIVGGTSLTFFLFTRFNVFLMGYFGYIIEVGVYEFVNKIIIALLLPFSIFAQVIAPRVTALVAAEKGQQVLGLFKKSILLTGLLSFIISIVFYVATIFGFEYIFAQYDTDLVRLIVTALLITIVSQSINIVASLGFSVASGHAKINLLFLLLFMLVNIPLTTYCMIYGGYMLAIYCNVALRVLFDIFFIVYYHRKLVVMLNCQK